MVEAKLLELGAALGGFAGLMAMVMMIWFFRSQSARQKTEERGQAAGLVREDKRETADEVFRTTLVKELFDSRQELSSVIQRNTVAMTQATVAWKTICEDMRGHDERARVLDTNIRAIGVKLGVDNKLVEVI